MNNAVRKDYQPPFDPARERWLNEWIDDEEGAGIRNVSRAQYRRDAKAAGALKRFSPRVSRTRRRWAYGL
jgi:hypothetical protein